MPVVTVEQELMNERLRNLQALQGQGIEPYGRRFERSSLIQPLINHWEEGKEIRLAGRLMAIRSHGRTLFADLHDASGKIQLYAKEDELKERYQLFDHVDLGDFIGVEGILFKTKTGEPSVRVRQVTVLAKALRPLPEKWHGLKDIEVRYRQRYLDLVVNTPVRDVFEVRSRLIQKMREFLDARGFIEVETPMLQPIPGGATGRPFKTFHHVFERELYLRIAPELYLKRLLVGGLEKVYEINRSFRNEGISTRHNPEFTMLELYEAYADWEGMMELTKELIQSLARELLGLLEISYQGRKIDLSTWKRWSFAQAMQERFGIRPSDPTEVWIKKLIQGGFLKPEEVQWKGTLARSQVVRLIEESFEPDIQGYPVFVVDYFTELSPLAKTQAHHPELAERFELFIAGMEVANAYSELNDPIEQRKRFERQADWAKELEQPIDEDFLRALEHGMPPAGGLGIGIDRLTMLLTDQSSIRDVILFPQLRPEHKEIQG